jgi:hypothetical protein
MGRLFTDKRKNLLSAISWQTALSAKNAGETHFLSSARMALLAILFAGIASFFLPTS